MDYIQTVILALIQGLTEFLPISSAAHLILPSAILGWPDQGLAFDTAVHLGTLLAVMLYFRGDLYSLGRALIKHLSGHASAESYFAINLLIASLPLIPTGFLLKDMIEHELRSVHIIVVTTLAFAVLLYGADRLGRQTKTSAKFNPLDALAIGFAQCFALVPGTSRSGVTMTLALVLGYTREHASRIAFLLSIPAIGGAATLKTIDLVQANTPVAWQFLGVGLFISFVSAYACIHLFLEVIQRIGFTPFVIYRLALGALLCWTL